MDSSTPTFLASVTGFFKDTVLVMLGDTLTWAASNEYVKYFLYISLVSALIGIAMRVRHAI